jgi:F0F1-type ATP synthase epsilon subunit
MMFCQLGLGIMEVKTGQMQMQELQKPSCLIDGGFALFASNLLTVIAYDAVSVQDLTAEQLDNLLQKAQKHLTRKDLDPKQLRHELAKTKFLEKLIDL